VFTLAERLRRQYPARPVSGGATASPWRSRPGRHLLRGVLFTLPALCYLAVSGQVAGPAAGTVVVASLLLSWTISQAMAYLGYVRLGSGDPAAAARVLRGVLLRWGAVAAIACGALATVLEVPVVVGVLAVSQVGYLLAATVALVQGAERTLLLALLPGAAGNAGALLAGGGTWPAVAAWGSAATVVATLAVALRSTAGAGLGLTPPARELAAAAPHALYGLFAGGLVVFVPATQALVDAAGPGASAARVGMLPLTASMGVAEWLLYRYRAGVHRALQRATKLAELRRRAAPVLLGAVGTYLAVLAGGSALAVLATGAGPELPPLAAIVAVGGALFVTLLLLSCGARAVAVAGCGAALTFNVMVTAAAVHAGRPVDAVAIQFATAAGLFTVLLAYAFAELGKATRHR
jgi:hypothetical protein